MYWIEIEIEIEIVPLWAVEADKEFLYLPYEVQTQTIVATRAERANSHKLSHATDGCGTQIGSAVPSKSLLISFLAAEEAVTAGTRRRSECRDRCGAALLLVTMQLDEFVEFERRIVSEGCKYTTWLPRR